MDEMYDKYIVGDEAGKLNSLKTAVERLLHDVFTSLKSAGGDIGGFRQYLMGKTSFVKDATDIYQIKDVLSGLIRQSTETQGNMAKLESNLASLSEEMEGVRAEYSRVLQERLLTL